MHTSQYLYFDEVPCSTKTKKWDIISKSGGYPLGRIKWYGAWRQYCFFPDIGTIWNKGCLEDINRFIEDHKNERN